MSAENNLAAWLAVALAMGAAVLAFAMLRSRSLFITAAAVAAMSALAASALLLLGGGDGVISLVAFGVGLAPVLLLGAGLLSARTAKSGRGGFIVHGAALVAAIAAAVLVAPELGAGATSTAPAAPAPLWLGALIFVTAAACVAVLGYGERGVLERRDQGPNA
jgi:hypothetical protein